MALPEIFVGDVGTVLIGTVKDNGTVVDISGASTKQIKFRIAGGTTLTKAGTFTTDGTDGKLQYTTVAGDISTEGKLEWQVYLVGVASWTGHSSIAEATVRETL